MPIHESGLHADYVFDDEEMQKVFNAMSLPQYFAKEGRGKGNISKMDGVIEDIRGHEDVGLPRHLTIHVSNSYDWPRFDAESGTLQMPPAHLRRDTMTHELQHAFDVQNIKDFMKMPKEERERRANNTERRYR